MKDIFFLPLGKVIFIVSSYGIYFGLSRLLSPEEFGIYGVVVGLVSIISMVLITGTLQAVSKLVSESRRVQAPVRQALRQQMVLGGGIFVAFWLLSGSIARWLNDASLTPYLRLASFILLFYSFYAIFIGALNGMKQFRAQGCFDIGYAILKMLLILSFTAFGLSIPGALGGFVLAAATIAGLGALYVFSHYRSDPPEPGVSNRWLLIFQTVVMGVIIAAGFHEHGFAASQKIEP